MMKGREARDFRSRGHSLKPAVMIGDKGVSENVIKAIKAAFVDTDLIKVKVHDTSDIDRKEFALELAHAVGARVAQVLGKTILLHKPMAQKKKEETSK